MAQRSTRAGLAGREDVAERFAVADLVELALSLRGPVALHGVSSELRASLIEDLIFRFAVFVDERARTNLHEGIAGALRERAAELAELPSPADVLVAEVEIEFIRGRTVELNVLRSSLAHPEHLLLTLEMALGVRDVGEVGRTADTAGRFSRLLKRRGGLRALRVVAADVEASVWREVPLRGAPHDDFDGTVAGLASCIRAACAASTEARALSRPSSGRRPARSRSRR
jgi:hypothetical protein